jgi:STE24 endopeptidase
VRQTGDPRSFGLFMALAGVFGAVTGPAFNAYSRRNEARADRYGLELTQDPDTTVRMYRRISVMSIADLEPSPQTTALFGTHPSMPRRIAAARAWAAEHDMPVPGPLVPPTGS